MFAIGGMASTQRVKSMYTAFLSSWRATEAVTSRSRLLSVIQSPPTKLRGICDCSRSTSTHFSSRYQREHRAMSTGKYVPPSRRAGAAPEALFTIQAVAAAPSPLTESSSRPYSSGNGNAPGKPDDPAGPSGSNGVRQGQQHSPHLRSQRGWAHGLPEASSIRSRTLRREDLLHHFGHPHDGTLNFFGYLNPVGRSGRNEATMSDKKVNDRPAHLRFKARSEPADATPTSSSTSPSRSPRNGITATREITELPSTTASVDVGTPGDISETIGSMSLSDRPSSPPILPSPHPLAHLVSYIIVFHNAQPAWESDRELWVHTSAEVMTRDCEGQKKNFGRPIPVFQAQGSRQSFEFAEWW